MVGKSNRVGSPTDYSIKCVTSSFYCLTKLITIYKIFRYNVVIWQTFDLLPQDSLHRCVQSYVWVTSEMSFCLRSQCYWHKITSDSTGVFAKLINFKFRSRFQLNYIFILAEMSVFRSTRPLPLHRPLKVSLLLLVLVLAFSPWASLGRNQSPVRRPVWLWYAASWASS